MTHTCNNSSEKESGETTVRACGGAGELGKISSSLLSYLQVVDNTADNTAGEISDNTQMDNCNLETGFLTSTIATVAFSKHRPSGPMLSISRNVRLSVCLSVCVFFCSLLRYRSMVFLPPVPEVRFPIFLEIWNPWGKVVERSGLIFENFCLKIV